MTTELIIRLLVAGVLGGLIGLEREFRSKVAGVRTHFLVALGSALFMLVSAYGFEGLQAGRYDVSRVAAQVVSGIGFIGAGTIIFQKKSVHGLTTAAGMWVTAAIGLACGVGMYLIAAVATVMVLIVLEVMHYAVPQFGEKAVTVVFFADDRSSLLSVMDAMRKRKIRISSYSIVALEGPGFKATMDVKVRSENYLSVLGKLMDEIPGAKLQSID